MNVILLDTDLLDSTGIETFTELSNKIKNIPIIVLVQQDEQIGIRAVKEGAQDYLVKEKFKSTLLTTLIRFAFDKTKPERRRW